MKKNSLLILVSIWLTTFAPSVLANNTILLLGDSISASYSMEVKQGWVSLLNKQYQAKQQAIHIINASISGETTAGGLSRLPALLAQHNVDYVIIELGGNDGLRGYSPKVIKNNLLQMIKLAQAENIKVALMQIKIPPNYGQRYLSLFEDIYPQLAKQNQITLLPFFMEEIALNPALMMKDRIHPNIAAQPIIAEHVYHSINHLLTATE